MRITTFLFLLAIIAYFAQGFNAPKCEHKFTAVEQANITIDQPDIRLGGSVYREYSWPSGRQEGKELICVKCFHVQKQILDYGQTTDEREFDWLHWGKPTIDFDTCKPFSASSFAFDTASVHGSNRILFIKGDTLMWSK